MKPNEKVTSFGVRKDLTTTDSAPFPNAKQNRAQFYDLAGGILILWIMTFHAINTCKVFGEVDARVALPFLTFSMPWFFYKSGKFFKVMPLGDGVAKDVRKLLIPFLKWSMIGYILYLLLLAVKGSFTWHDCVADPLETLVTYGYIPLDVPAWFVLSLFFVRVIARYLFQWRIPPVAVIVISIGIGFVLHLTDNPLPFYVPNVAMGVAFFMVGYRFGRYETNKALLAIGMVGYVAFLLLGPSIVGHHRNILLAGDYLLWPLFAYCGIITFNNLCRFFNAALSLTVFAQYRPIEFIGRHTLILLVTHAFIYFPITRLSTLAPWQTVGIIFAGYLLFLTPLLLLKLRNRE